jgi:hypothetical protein
MKEDIIKMAREWLPKAYRNGDVDDEPKFTKHNMEVAFAAGAAAEREACAKLCIEQSARWHTDQRDVYVVYECAAAIRARGQA